MKADPVADSVTSTWRPTCPSPRDPGAAVEDKAEALPVGARLDEFEILGLLGSGGFGAVYLARDHALLRNVAVKEYLPVDFARRGRGLEVVARRESDRESFATGLQSFMREAQLLAGFDHPSLVKVHRFWEANGTAYMVMPHYPGRTLKQVRRGLEGGAHEAWLRGLLEPMLAALETLHAANVCHRDISPDNILLQPDGVPVLLDFGCARQVVHDRTQALTAIFKPSFAAIEQYGDDPGLKQGAWTDLYALGGVIRYLITGAPPTPAAMRAVKDSMPPLAEIAADSTQLSRSFLQAIDWALEVDPARRPQSVAALRAALAGPDRADHAVADGGVADGDVADGAVTDGDRIDGGAGAGRDASSIAVAASPRAPQAARHRSKARLALAFAIPLTLAAAVWSAAEQIRAHRPEGAPNQADAMQAPSAVGREPVLKTQPVQPRAEAPAPAAPAPQAALSVAPPAAAARREMADEPRQAVAGVRGAPADRHKRDAAVVVSAPGPAAQARTDPSASNAPASALQRPMASVATPARAMPAAPAAPREACGERNFLSMAVCMDRQCRQPQYRSHPQCEEFIRYAEARRQSERGR
jgi:hypothetical protein